MRSAMTGLRRLWPFVAQRRRDGVDSEKRLCPGRQFRRPDALQRFDDLSSIPCQRPRQLADEAILLCLGICICGLGICIGGVLDKRCWQVRQIDKRVRQSTDGLRGECGRRSWRGSNWIGGRWIGGRLSGR